MRPTRVGPNAQCLGFPPVRASRRAASAGGMCAGMVMVPPLICTAAARRGWSVRTTRGRDRPVWAWTSRPTARALWLVSAVSGH